ncbi:MAG: UPF0182 family protein [Chloroflexi bacterium]|nr:UPF0182 family protein [Chloroflexota bacterium]
MFPTGLEDMIKWGLAAVAVIFLFIALSFGRGIYTDLLWFDNLGFRSVFVSILTTRMWLFIVGAITFALFLSINIFIAYRFSRGEVTIPIPPEAVNLLKRLIIWGAVLTVIFLSLIFGSVAQGRWEIFLRFLNSVPFGEVDPLFGRNISSYVFTLPIYNFVQGWLLGAIIVTIVAAVGLYFVNYSLRGTGIPTTTAVRVHISILGALLMFVIAWSHYLDTWELLFSNTGAIFGAAYTDVHARLPALRFLTVIAVASGILMLVNAYLRGIRLIVGAFGLWIAASIILGSVYPGLLQRFSVDPNEFTREEEFIARNIKFTRQGFGLEAITEQSYPAKPTLVPNVILENTQTIKNIRLWDHRPLKDVYNQIQFIRLYYDFLDIDVDRYVVDGEYRQVMLGARELAPEKLPPQAQRWVNQRLQYTHGLGVAVSPVTEFSSEGRPIFFAKDIPPKGTIDVQKPQIYYGENTSTFVIVNTNTAEFDYPTEEDIPVYTKYVGKGGVQLSSLLRRLAYTWQFADVNILISKEITSDSRIKYRRLIQERINTVAPFLRLDHDPYIVAEDGRLFWIQDAYTTTNLYPYSEPFGNINYIRNSVKVVVDAYEGTLDFYIADESDPLIKAYQSAFPALFKHLDQMPAYLKNHIRYPEDLFSIQAQKYLQYHMTDTRVFYNKEDQWSTPTELFFGSSQPMEPYYLIMKLPGEEKEEFVLLLPFTPSKRPNLIGWLAARSDGEQYGKLTAFKFPKDRQIDGPQQIEARIDNDTFISQQFTLWGQGGSTVLRGNLLVIPVSDSLIYVEPIYLQPEALAFPELKRVIVVSSDKVAMEPSLSEALVKVVGVSGLAGITPQPTTTGTTSPTQPTPKTSAEEMQRGFQDLGNAIQRLKDELGRLEEALQRLKQLAQGP